MAHVTATGTGTWQQVEDDLKDPMPERDFFIPPTDISDTTYVDAHKLDFGFNAREICIANHGSHPLLFQWPRNDGTTKDNGIVEAGAMRIWRNANRSGVNFRADASATEYSVDALA